MLLSYIDLFHDEKIILHFIEILVAEKVTFRFFFLSINLLIFLIQIDIFNCL